VNHWLTSIFQRHWKKLETRPLPIANPVEESGIASRSWIIIKKDRDHGRRIIENRSLDYSRKHTSTIVVLAAGVFAVTIEILPRNLLTISV